MSESPDRKELKAGWKNEVKVQVFKKQEVAKHNEKKDNWIIIHGKVYDVSEYGRDHPGGLDVLLEVAGQDATTAYEDVGHSQDAEEIMQGLLVGVLEGVDPNATNESSAEKKNRTEITINRRTIPQEPPSQDHKWMHRAELVAFAVATVSLTYAANRYHLLQTVERSAQSLGLQTNVGGFTQGFITAAAVLGITGFAGARYLSKQVGGQEFTSFAPYMPSAHPEATFQPKGVLNQTVYQKFKLRSKDELNDGIWRFVFDLPTKYSILGLPIGQHVAIKANIDDHSVVRSYTPVSNNRDLGRLELLIRVYPKGQVGNYLKNLPVGDSAEIRGPKGAMKYRRDMAKHIGMIGGGTGITPMYQLIRAICEDPKDNTKVSLIYGNRSEQDIMLREKLDHYARTVPEKFKVHYTLDQPGPTWNGGKGHVTKELISEHLPAAAPDSKVLLCGPPGMVNAMKNNLIELGFEGPGAVSKMTDQIFCF